MPNSLHFIKPRLQHHYQCARRLLYYSKMKIPFSKAQANGNDFILFHDPELQGEIRNPKVIQALCHRRFGIGADGILIALSSKDHDFNLEYYNSDGSWETLCANGSRCAVQFLYQKGQIEKEMAFEAGDGLHRAEVLSSSLVKLSMNTPKYETDLVAVSGFEGYHIDSGAPHFVCQIEELNEEFVLNAARKIRRADIFQPRGINVNFYKPLKNGSIEIKTYEKGVEKVMLSCASGSTAVVYHLSQSAGLISPVTTISAGGKLKFTFDSIWKEPWMEGPAKILFTSEIDIKDFI